MEAVELIALASSVSLLAGWRLYLVTLVTGLAMKFGWIDLPDRLQALDVIANNWVIGIAGGRHARRILRRQDRLGRQRVGRDPLLHPAAWRRAPQPRDHRCRRPRLAGRQLPARRRRGVRRPCRKGRRADHRQRQPRAVQQHRRLDRRGCRHRRPARAGHRQPDRRRADRGDPGPAVAVAGGRGAAPAAPTWSALNRTPHVKVDPRKENQHAARPQPARRTHCPGARRSRAEQECQRRRRFGRRATSTSAGPIIAKTRIAVLKELREPDPSMAQAGDAATWQKMVHAALDQK